MNESRGQSQWARYRAVLSRRPFLLLWSGSAVSSLGDHFFEIALMWFTYAATRSSLEVAAVAVVFQVTYVVVGPVAGVFADRWDRRRTMILSDVARVAILGAFFIVTRQSGFSFPLALFAVFLLESVGRLFGPSRFAYLPTLVEREDLITANGLMSGTGQATGLGGQAMAGFVITAVGAVAGFLIDAVSFAMSALSLALIRPEAPRAVEALVEPAPDEKPRQRFWAELRDGYRTLAGISVIRVLVLFAIVANAFFAMIGPAMPAYVRTDLHAGAWAYGLVGSLQFAGALVGGFLAGVIAARFRAGILLALGVAFGGIAVALVGVLRVVPLALGVWASWGFSLSVVGVVEQSLDQVLIPQAYLARARALISSVGMVLMPVGSLAGGFLANRIGPGPLYVVVGLGIVASALAMLAHPTIRLADIGAPTPQTASG